MTHPIDDHRLADYLEGLLTPDQSAELEAALAADSALKARLERLRGLLEEPVELLPIEPPITLQPRVEEKLERQLQLMDEVLQEPVELLPIEPPGGLLERVQAELGRQLDLMDQVLQEPVELLPIEPPPGLIDVVHARLEEEGLMDTLPGEVLERRVPPDLHAQTMARLEEEGLVRAAAPAAATPPCPEETPQPAKRPEEPAGGSAPVIPFPTRQPLWRMAAALLVACGLGLLVGFFSRDTGQATRLALQERVDTLEHEVETLGAVRAENRDLQQRIDNAREQHLVTIREAHERSEGLRTDLAASRERLDAQRVELEQAAEEAEGMELALARARTRVTELESRPQSDPGLASKVEALELALRNRDAEIAALEEQNSLAEARITQLEVATQQDQADGLVTQALLVQQARHIDVLDYREGVWLQVPAGSELAPGTVVRAASADSSLVSKDLPYDLRAGVYVVTAQGRLEPVPDETTAREPSLPLNPASWEESFRDLLARLSSRSKARRSEAQTALTYLYFNLVGDTGTPPVTAEDWEAWWSEARDEVKIAMR